MRQNLSKSLLCGAGIVVLLLPLSVLARTYFEKGDAVFREGYAFKKILVLHDGIYSEWDPSKEPQRRESHWVVDAITDGVNRVVAENYERFCRGYTPWPVGTMDLTAAQRRKIASVARDFEERGAVYAHGRTGYKNPNGNPPSFRCDGLVEYCYEIAMGDPWEPGDNGGIIEDDTWLTLVPMKQLVAMQLGVYAQLDTVCILEPSADDTVSIEHLGSDPIPRVPLDPGLDKWGKMLYLLCRYRSRRLPHEKPNKEMGKQPGAADSEVLCCGSRTQAGLTCRGLGG